MLVVAYDNRSNFEIAETILEEIEDAMVRTLLHQEIEVECEVSFSFVSAAEIKDLNSEYRGKDAVTDVLSFPMYEDFIRNKYKGKVLTIDVDNLDYKNRPEDFKFITDKIDSILFGLFDLNDL